jgi:hypothetical protein
MSIEKLGDFLKNDSSKGTLKKAYYASLVQRDVSKLTPDPLKIIMKRDSIVVRCSNASQGKYLLMNLNKIYRIIAKHDLGSYKIKITQERFTGQSPE